METASGSRTTSTISGATCYLGVGGVCTRWPPGRRCAGLSEEEAAAAAAAQHYLETVELEWDWLEVVVAALSWEKPLWLDSRLVIEPLKSSDPITSV